MAIGEKETYLARGESISPGEGPREDVVGSTQLMSAGRFDQILKARAQLDLYGASAWLDGGAPREDAVSHFFSSINAQAGTGASLTLTHPRDPSDRDVIQSHSYICGWCSVGTGGRPSAGFAFDLSDIDQVDIPFEDDPGTDYNVGIAVTQVPARSEQNPRTGIYEFTEELSIIGVQSLPQSVTYDAGLDQTTLVLPEETLIGGDLSAPHSLAGRTALAWKVDPLGETDVAIFTGLVTFTTDNEIIVDGAFGQDPGSVSLTAADYRFCIVGPAIYANALGSNGGGATTTLPGVAHIAYGNTTNGFDHVGQQRIPTMHLLTKTVIEMTDPSLLANVSRPVIGIRPNDSWPATTPIFSTYTDEAATTPSFRITKGGGIEGNIVGRYSTLSDFIENTTDGAVAVVDPSDYSRKPFDIIASEPADQNRCYHMHSDGRYLFTMEGDELAPQATLRVYDTEDLESGFLASIGANISIAGGAGAPVFTAFSADGTHMAYAVNDGTAFAVQCYSWDSTTDSITYEWEYVSAPAVQINDVVCSNGAVYVVEEDDGAGGDNIIRMPYTAGTGGASVTTADADWTAKFAAATFHPTAVCAGGGYVIVAGDDDGGAGGNQIKVYNDDAVETLVNTLDLGTGFDVDHRMADTDGVYIYLLASDASMRLFRVPIDPKIAVTFDALDIVGSAFTSGATLKAHLVVDQRFIIFSNDGFDEVQVIEKSYQSGSQPDPVIMFENAAGLGVDEIHDVATDGTRLFIATEDAGGVCIIRAHHPYSAPTTYRRVSLTDPNLPYRQAAQPVDSAF